jgi:hypothetical protein
LGTFLEYERKNDQLLAGRFLRLNKKRPLSLSCAKSKAYLDAV